VTKPRSRQLFGLGVVQEVLIRLIFIMPQMIMWIGHTLEPKSQHKEIKMYSQLIMNSHKQKFTGSECTFVTTEASVHAQLGVGTRVTTSFFL